MHDNFVNLLKKYRLDNNLSQNDLVDILSAHNSFLSKLDVVTLSRWENGKTEPSLEKKIKIMRALNLLVTYLYSIRKFNTATNIEKSLNIRFGMEINKYKTLNNFENTNDIRFKISNNKKNIYNNIRKYLMSQDKTQIGICKEWPINIGSWYSDGNIEAFFIHVFVNKEIYNRGHCDNWRQVYKKKKLNNIDSIILLEQVTSTRVFYKLCLLCLFDTVIKNNDLEYIFVHVNTEYFLNLCMKLGFKTITTVSPSLEYPDENMTLKYICILEANTKKLLANKDFLFFCLKNYHDLKINNPILLQEIYETSIHSNTLENYK